MSYSFDPTFALLWRGRLLLGRLGRAGRRLGGCPSSRRAPRPSRCLFGRHPVKFVCGAAGYQSNLRRTETRNIRLMKIKATMIKSFHVSTVGIANGVNVFRGGNPTKRYSISGFTRSVNKHPIFDLWRLVYIFNCSVSTHFCGLDESRAFGSRDDNRVNQRKGTEQNGRPTEDGRGHSPSASEDNLILTARGHAISVH